MKRYPSSIPSRYYYVVSNATLIFILMWHRSIHGWTLPASYSPSTTRQSITSTSLLEHKIVASLLKYRKQQKHRRTQSRQQISSPLSSSTSSDDPSQLSSSSSSSSSLLLDSLYQKRILVVGGSGRVGGSVVRQLVQYKAKVTVGGRNEQRWNEAWSRYQKLWDISTNVDGLESSNRLIDFVNLDCRQVDSVSDVLYPSAKPDPSSSSSSSLLLSRRYDLVVHTAGPFQGKVNVPNGVLEACIQHGIPYVDVCDDYCTACAAKTKFAKKAQESQVPCIISTGCWPGVSSLMAKQLIHTLQRQNLLLETKDLSVDFSFFTAGSGGAGVTLLVATFLILAEEALTIVHGRRRSVPAMKEYRTANFGPVVGDREVSHLNLLETASIHDVLKIPNVTSRFGTAPSFWNRLLGIMAQLPPSVLANEDWMTKLAIFSLPIVRLVDFFAGATNAMRCDVRVASSTSSQRSACDNENDMSTPTATAIYAHENLESCVGECVVPFCAAVLSGKVLPGVWFPEEAIEAGDAAAQVLRIASKGAHTAMVQGCSVKCDDVWGENSHPIQALNVAV